MDCKEFRLLRPVFDFTYSIVFGYGNPDSCGNDLAQRTRSSTLEELYPNTRPQHISD